MVSLLTSMSRFHVRPVLPCEQTCLQFDAMASGIHLVPRQSKVLPDRTEAREKPLCAPRVANALHLAFATRAWADGCFRHGY
ncbi:hypothetical protein [Paraburkholderia franconis]|uniref:hypothetical protein n=1 Tax=Paraburkholderia franconis TaxID=2654983 RepID=UPI00187B76D6|nr:hypothetical protein [Paraburkholderia franconis]